MITNNKTITTDKLLHVPQLPTAMDKLVLPTNIVLPLNNYYHQQVHVLHQKIITTDKLLLPTKYYTDKLLPPTKYYTDKLLPTTQ